MSNVALDKSSFFRILKQYIAENSQMLNANAFLAFNEGVIDEDMLFDNAVSIYDVESFDEDNRSGFDKVRYRQFMDKFLDELVRFVFLSHFPNIPQSVYDYFFVMGSTMIYRCSEVEPEVWTIICRQCGIVDSGTASLCESELYTSPEQITHDNVACFFTPLVEKMRNEMKRIKLLDVDINLTASLSVIDGDEPFTGKYIFTIGPDIRQVIYDRAIQEDPTLLDKYFHPSGEVY